MIRKAKKPKILKLKAKILKKLGEIKDTDNIQILHRDPLSFFMRLSFVFKEHKIDAYKLLYVRSLEVDHISFSYSVSGKALTSKEIHTLAKALNL